jgi:hypothetical protein
MTRPAWNLGSRTTALWSRAGVEPEGASGDRSQAEDRQPDRPYASGVAMQSPDHHAFHTGCLGLQSHQVTRGCFIQAPAVVDYQHVARCCRFECLQKSIDAAGMPGGTDTTGQAAARHHGTQERTSATHWDSGAHTGVGHVSRGEGSEPVLQHLVVHDDVCSLMWPRA